MNQELSNFAARLRDSIIAGFDAARFDDLAVELFDLQYQYNPIYRSLCLGWNMSPSKLGMARAMMPTFAGRWTMAPFMPTSAFKLEGVTFLPLKERSAAFHSSGTTEQKRSCHYYNA